MAALRSVTAGKMATSSRLFARNSVVRTQPLQWHRTFADSTPTPPPASTPGPRAQQSQMAPRAMTRAERAQMQALYRQAMQARNLPPSPTYAYEGPAPFSPSIGYQSGQIDRSGLPPPKAPGQGPYLLLFFGLVAITPPIVYFYHQHRKEHMRAKKQAILEEMQARARAG